jgi:hypothetical protein
MHHLPQGPSLGSGLFCPGPSSLNRPHPPHSQAHRDFAAERLIRNAFAVRERLGDPRVVPSFRCSLLPGMPSSLTPGSSTPICPDSSDANVGLRRIPTGSALPTIPQIRFPRVFHFVASLVRFPLRPVRLLAPLHGSNRVAPASEGFYVQAFNESVALLVAGYDYNSNWTSSVGGTFTRWNGS